MKSPWSVYAGQELAIPSVDQSTRYTCGPACLAAILQAFGVDVSEDEVTTLAKTDEGGTSPHDLVRAAEHYGLSARVIEGATLPVLRGIVGRGQGAIVALQAWAEDEPESYAERWTAGHYVVVTGFADDSAISGEEHDGAVVIVEDPAVEGRRVVLPEDEFVERWHAVHDGAQHEGVVIAVRGSGIIGSKGAPRVAARMR